MPKLLKSFTSLAEEEKPITIVNKNKKAILTINLFADPKLDNNANFSYINKKTTMLNKQAFTMVVKFNTLTIEVQPND
jgi:hypothetical protein